MTDVLSPTSTASLENRLSKRVARLAGVGEKTAVLLRKSQIVSIFDLLLHVPKSIVSQEQAAGFFHLEAGRHYVVKGKVIGVKITGFNQKRRLEAILQDDTGRLSVIFFGPAVNYAQQVLKEDATVTLAAEVKNFLGRPQMVHPKILSDQSSDAAASNVATYSQLAGLNSAVFKRIVSKAILEIRAAPELDHVGQHILSTHKMASLKQALIDIHEPGENKKNQWDERGISPSFRRLAFEELVSFYLRLNLERSLDKIKNSYPVPIADLKTLTKDFLPFSLTHAQERVIEEIIHDMNKPTAMTRLLQGDVGSGKTAVSAVISKLVATAGLQVAVMAPTEILAEQLYQVFQSFFNHQGLNLGLLTASTKTKERKLLLEKIAAHQINIVVGTHALLSDDVGFNKLGLVIIDEQHRFGVKQRAELLEGRTHLQGFCPHLLVMSATPIPRSLALTVYGDLELSVIDERPPGRIPVHTQIFTGPVLKSVERLCERILSTKQKAFIVFPLVEESESLDLAYAKKALTLLQEKFGVDKSMLLHGKMKADEKAQAMLKFREGHISFLVATTVVEVGVDVPDATCMVIVHPERFGLAQLHQLRGRVGRKDLKSFCFLVTDLENKFGTAYKRLNAMCNTDNGFKLAEIDLEIRGPGELLGVKQSGLPNFLIFNHSDFPDLVSPAKAYAQSIIKNGVNSRHAHLFIDKGAHFS